MNLQYSIIDFCYSEDGPNVRSRADPPGGGSPQDQSQKIEKGIEKKTRQR